MRLLAQILLICCVSSIHGVKDIPRIKGKVSDAIDQKKSQLLGLQKIRDQKSHRGPAYKLLKNLQ